MAGCVLRAAGTAFAPGAFLATFPLPDANHRESSLNVLVSDRGGDDLSGHVLDALSFLREHAAAVKALVALPGVSVCLDFGLWQKDKMSQSVAFAPDLVALVGELGLGLEASLYAAAP